MPKKQQTLVFGAGTRKIQPRLRMIGNGSAEVNTVRAEQCASIVVTSKTLLRDVPPRIMALGVVRVRLEN